MKKIGSLAVAVVLGCLALPSAHAAKRADTGSAYASRYFDFSIGLFAAEGIMTHKRIWAPLADVPSLRSVIGAFLVPSVAITRGFRFELGLGLFSLEPPLTFAIAPGFKIFPFHKYSFKAPMTKRKGGKWVPPPPIDGPYVRVAAIITIGSIGVKDKEDSDRDCNNPDYTDDSLCMADETLLLGARNDKARAPFIIGGSLGIGYFFRSKGEKPEAPEAPEAPAPPGAGEGLTDWGSAPGDVPAPPPPEMPAPPAPPEIEEPEPPEPPKPSAVGFNFEVVTSLISHGRLADVPAPYRGRYDLNGGTSACISGMDDATGGGPLGGAGPNFIADCEQGTLELRFELRIGVEMWLF